MTRIRAFDGYLVNSGRLEDVVSPAYDALTAAERHAFGAAHPHNYINAMRSLDEYPEDEQPTQDEPGVGGHEAPVGGVIPAPGACRPGQDPESS